MGSTKEVGIVRWFNSRKGYGFINKKDEPDIDIFVHYSYVDMDGYKTLSKGQEVSFDLEKTDRGPQAHNVTPVVP